jgi:outer membrane protein assembly factor BamB
VYVAGDLVLAAAGIRLSAFGAADGKKRWSVKLKDEVGSVGLADGKLRVSAGSAGHVLVDPKSGAVTPQMGSKPAATVIRHDKRESCFYYSIRKSARKALEAKGVTKKAAFCPDEEWTGQCTAKSVLVKHGLYKQHRCSKDLGLVYAVKRGSPVLTGYIKKLKQIVWNRPVAEPGSKGRLNHPPRVAFCKDRAVVFYTLAVGRRQESRLKLLTWQTGRVIWDRPVDFGRKIMPHYVFVTLTRQRIFAVDRRKRTVYAFDSGSGQLIGRYGGKF